jgi:hypothetical protein
VAEEPVDSELRLRFDGREADEHRVPASVVAQAIDGLQRAVFLLAMEHERVDVRQRERTSRKIEEKYAVFVSAPEKGSVTFAAEIHPTRSDLLAAGDVAAVASMTRDALSAIEAGDESAIGRLVSGRNRRHRLIDSVRGMMPRPGSGLRLQIEDGHGRQIFSSALAQRSIQTLTASRLQDEAAKRTVTGRLVTIKFDERKLTLLYPPTNRELECIYDESVETLLLQHPRDLIQVSGEVILDADDQPKKIIDVDEILEVDMSPFYLTQFEYPDQVLAFRNEIALEPELDESQQLMIVREEALGIDVVAPTREELFQSLSEEILLLWRNYALAADAELSAKARELKARLLESIEERSVAPR